MHFPGISSEAADYLVSKNILGVGIDTASIDPGISSDFPAHKVILSKGCFNIENLCNLEHLPAVGATIIAAPIKFLHAEEAPARVVGFY